MSSALSVLQHWTPMSLKSDLLLLTSFLVPVLPVLQFLVQLLLSHFTRLVWDLHFIKRAWPTEPMTPTIVGVANQPWIFHTLDAIYDLFLSLVAQPL